MKKKLKSKINILLIDFFLRLFLCPNSKINGFTKEKKNVDDIPLSHPVHAHAVLNFFYREVNVHCTCTPHIRFTCVRSAILKSRQIYSVFFLSLNRIVVPLCGKRVGTWLKKVLCLIWKKSSLFFLTWFSVLVVRTWMISKSDSFLFSIRHQSIFFYINIFFTTSFSFSAEFPLHKKFGCIKNSVTFLN